MSDAVAELATRFRLSDPKPGHCSACWCAAGPEVRFVDFDCMLDRGAIVEEGSMAVLDAMDELHLCEACVRQACELLGLKPELHQRQLREIRRLELDAEHWRAYAKRLEGTLQDRPEQPRRGRR